MSVAKKKRARGRKVMDPVALGEEALRRGDYDGAIAAWEQVQEKSPSQALTSALAEVYFRRGLVRFYRHGQQKSGLADLEQAARLTPGEARYAYHLGLAHHRRADLDTAFTAYLLALDADPRFSRAAEMAILAMLEQHKDPVKSAAWETLPVDRQAEFKPLIALVRGEPPAGVPAHVESGSAGPARLWRGLAALRSGDDSGIETVYDIAQDDSQPEPVRAVAAYALGVDALRSERQEEAQAHWEAARRFGLNTPALRSNLRLLYRARAEEMMKAEQWAEAASLTDSALEIWPGASDLGELAIVCHFQAGHAQALAAHWQAAAQHWEKARGFGESSRALAQDLALAYEKSERFQEAADLWREVVRRRPRKADAPDALTSEQVALLWGHVAECYRRAGDAEEAATTLRNAIKNDPKNTDLRLELVDTMVANDQWGAAGNELGRILRQEPEKVGALVRAARINEMDGYLLRARGLWKKVLELDPHHLEALDRLAELSLSEGARLLKAGKIEQALDRFREAQTYTPDQPYLYLASADGYFSAEDRAAGRQELEHAFLLDSTDLDLFHSAVDLCHTDGQPEDAEWVITRAEELAGPHFPGDHLPADFYLEIADCCFTRRQMETGEDYVQRAERAAEGDPDALVDVGLFYLDHDQASQALPFFDRALRLDPEHGWANFHVGYSYAIAAEMREANRHWRQARRTARRSDDKELLQAIEMAREHFQRLADMIDRGLDPFQMMGMFDEDDEPW
jgi:tetratricopeptide (TPR) repeat protein